MWLHKTSLGGQHVIYKIDADDLEKVEKESHPINPIFWHITKFDENMIFRDKSSGELFVFDKEGRWNEDSLKHPLIY